MNPKVEKILKLPLYQRILILVAVQCLLVGAFVYFLYLPKQEEYRSLQDKNRTLETQLRDTRRIADDLPKFQAEYEKMKKQLDAALSELPNQKEIDSLLTSIAALAKDQGLEVLTFRPGGEIPRGFYADVPVSLNLRGSFHDLALFFQAVGDLSRIVNISNLNVGGVSLQDGKSILTVGCQATTFRFLQSN